MEVNKVKKPVYSKKSKIEGRGVFSSRDIKKGEEIIRYEGDKILKSEGDIRSEKQLKKGHLYIFGLNKKYDIDGNKNGNIAKYINHSCSPNCETVTYDNKEIWIVALKKIKQNEELTYDYKLTGDISIACKCGSSRCVKRI